MNCKNCGHPADKHNARWGCQCNSDNDYEIVCDCMVSAEAIYSEALEAAEARAAQAEADAADLLKAYREQKETIATLRAELEQARQERDDFRMSIVNNVSA